MKSGVQVKMFARCILSANSSSFQFDDRVLILNTPIKVITKLKKLKKCISYDLSTLMYIYICTAPRSELLCRVLLILNV